MKISQPAEMTKRDRYAELRSLVGFLNKSKPMNTVTPEQALETYEMTVKNEPLVECHADWTKAVTYALTTGDDSQLANYPEYVWKVFCMKSKKKCISFSDEVKQEA